MTTAQTVVFITGANQGIGLETAKELLHSPTYHIILGSRDLPKGLVAAQHLQSLLSTKGTVSALQIDVTSDASVDAAAATIAAQHGRLDVLVNNAGIVGVHNVPHRDAFRTLLDVNVVGALSVTEACLGLLRKSTAPAPRLVFVSSSMGSITHAADPGSPYYRPEATEYRCSKAALNMMMVMYWARLKHEGFMVFGADPGLCATNFAGDADALRRRGAAEPEEGGRRVAVVVKGERDADVGRVIGVYGVSPF